MRFRHAPFWIIGAIGAVVIAVSVLSNLIFSQMAAGVEQGQLDLMRSIVQFNLKGAEGKALARAALVADLPRVKELFAAQDRAGLLAELSPMFRGQSEKYGVDQAQFHVPPATSFLRLNKPEE